MNKLVIYGVGGFAREVHQIVCDINKVTPTWEFLGFLDDQEHNHGTLVHGAPVLGGGDWLENNAGVHVVVGIGSTRVKRLVAKKVEIAGAPFATLVHPRAWVGQNVAIGPGSVLCAGVSVTCDIVIGAHVIINLDCTVGHDAHLGDYVTVAPSTNISGNVDVGPGCDLGTNSTIIQGVAIGSWSVIGAGAVVVRELPDNVTAVGIPAKVIKQRPADWHM